MTLIIDYLLSMLKYSIVFTPIYIIFRIQYLKKVKTVNIYREITLLLFIIYLISIASQTIIPEWNISNGRLHINWRIDFINQINLIPFKTIGMYLTNIETDIIALYNILGNTILFSPFGAFLPMLWKKFDSLKRELLIAFLITSLIECMQIFLNRTVDIDDIILNIVGIIFGYAIFIILKSSKKFLYFINKIRFS
ncbi:hypothetical protein AN641_03845 [Candidatus Epulonipiscioides gigas]|nr:hypothetical protein AN641_03845 [Epulopiscium sp. SCG-C07WGA-EpuloA2]